MQPPQGHKWEKKEGTFMFQQQTLKVARRMSKIFLHEWLRFFIKWKD
jgi:hypothetical protein